MTLPPNTVLELAQALLHAERNRQPIPTLSSRYPDLDEEDAYRIAAAKFQLRNRKRTGYKLGYTSAAMRRQMNISSPNFGILSDDLLVDGHELPHASLIHPLAEPEIAIRLGSDLQLADNHDMSSVLAARPEFMLAIEVCDTRYPDYQFKAVDNIADNSSAARYMLGPASAVGPDTRLETVGVELWLDDEIVDQGIGANALENPLLAIAWLANTLSHDNVSLRAGEVVLTGGLTKGYRVRQGQRVRVVSDTPGVAEVSLRFV